MAIIKQFDKRSGITYVYDSKSYYDKEKKCSRAKRSERQLRKFKRKQKQAVVLRSDTGGQHICDALTIIETAKMQNRNVYDVVEAAFAK